MISLFLDKMESPGLLRPLFLTRATTKIQGPWVAPPLPIGSEAETPFTGPKALVLKERNKSHRGID